MAVSAAAGARVYIGPVNNSASTESAYAALSYTEVNEVESIGEFGDTSQIINFSALKDNRVRKLKGVRDAGDLQIVVGNDPRDAGQLAMIAAEASKFTYAFKVVLEDSPDANDTDTTIYFRALVVNKRLNVGTVNDVVKRTFVLAIDSPIVEDLSEAVA